MEDGKEDSTTDNFPSLCFLSALVLYYINVNCMYNLQKAVINPFLCSCNKYSGCRKPNVRDYCDICSLNIKHDPYENEKKYKIKHLIEKHIEMVDDFKKYNINIQNYDYVSKTFNRSSEFSFYEKVFLMDCSLKKKHFIN